ncbi:MAG: PAS domain S-box protein [Cyanothece sp. SIO1E1]|nr:PAS domain S-box protein [Cyanothece sp. SIO1E1]
MITDIFEQKLQVTQHKLAVLQQQAEQLPTEQEAMLSALVEELSVSMEELQVTAEELHANNRALHDTHQALATEHLHYQELFELSPDAHLVTDLRGVIQQANRKAVDLLNINQKFLVGKPLVVFLAAASQPKFHSLLTQLEELQSDQRPKQIELHIRPRNNSPFWAAVKVDVIYSRQHQTISLYWVIRNISQQKHTEIALQTNEQCYRSIVEEQPDLICRMLADGTITFVNPAFCLYFERTLEELLGQNFITLAAAEDQEAILKKLAELSHPGQVGRIEHRAILASGTVRWLQWDHRLLLSNQGHLIEFQSTGRDISNYKQTQQEIENTLQHQELLLQDINHYINNDLQGIQNNLQGIKNSMLKLHAMKIEGMQTSDRLKNCQDRVSMLSRMHSKLYHANNLGTINFAHYVSSLVPDLLEIYKTGTNSINGVAELRDES